MASSGNFCTWNPLVKGTENVSSGNCKLDMTTGNRGALGNFEIPLTGKWYFEGYIKMAANLEGVIGVSDAEVDLQSSRGGKNDGNTEALNFSQYSGSNYYAIKIDGGSEDAGGKIDLGTTDNAVIGVAVNRDDNELKLYANNTLRFTLTLSATTKYFPWCGVGGGTNSSVFVYLNAGQDSTFGGNKTAGGNADGNGFGDFAYSPPTGFLALCSANLPISDDIDPAQTDDNYPSKQFGVVTYTGNGGTQSITGLGFQPDAVWIKKRNADQVHQLYDSSRGVTKQIYPSQTGAEATYSNTVTSLDSDGFSLGAGDPNNSSDTYVAWCWKCNGGTTTSDSSGDITVTRQTNDAAKFSILTYTGSGSSGNTIAHGLGVKPAMTIIKQRNSSNGWNVWHQGYNDGDYDSFGELNDKAAWYANQGANGPFSAAPGTDYLTLTAYGQVNGSSNTYLAYVWADVEGYQKFGFYEGNGNADGPFVYTGFRPRLIFMKNADTGTRRWTVLDSERNTFNLVDSVINWDETQAEYDSSARGVDILSNGFKIRGTDSDTNQSGNTILYGAWGDVPFKYNNTF